MYIRLSPFCSSPETSPTGDMKAGPVEETLDTVVSPVLLGLLQSWVRPASFVAPEQRLEGLCQPGAPWCHFRSCEVWVMPGRLGPHGFLPPSAGPAWLEHHRDHRDSGAMWAPSGS